MKFKDVKDKILTKVAQLLGNESEDFVLIEGFFNPVLAPEASQPAYLMPDKPMVVPSVMVVGEKTGKVHFFATRSLGLEDEME